MVDDTASDSSESLPFNPTDFASIKLKIQASNVTSQTPINDTGLNLIEFGDHEFELEMPYSSCNAGHQLHVLIFQANSSVGVDKPLLDGTGKVISIDAVSSSVIKAKIKLIQFNEKEWENLLSLYSNRQEEIKKFLSAAKG